MIRPLRRLALMLGTVWMLLWISYVAGVHEPMWVLLVFIGSTGLALIVWAIWDVMIQEGKKPQ